jgi:hypothetical protein
MARLALLGKQKRTKKCTVCKDLSGHGTRFARLSVKNARKLRILACMIVFPPLLENVQISTGQPQKISVLLSE